MRRPTLRGGAFRRGAAVYFRWLKCYAKASLKLSSQPDPLPRAVRLGNSEPLLDAGANGGSEDDEEWRFARNDPRLWRGTVLPCHGFGSFQKVPMREVFSPGLSIW